MDKKNFKFWNRIVALTVFLVSAVTYLLTIEPTASFWDCGEFIASSYKLEVGHPPGNPVFQLFARFATLFTFGHAEYAALAVNAMNAILSALTILLLYLTTVFLVKRLIRANVDGTYSLAKSIIIMGSGAVGALAYTFSDTFWFSAVEGEVYAMSSLFTALVFWAMTKWYEQADEPYANRWLVLIAFLMGLSIGIHLLNLLTIPALVFLFFYRKREDYPYSPLQQLGIFLVSVVILAFILYGVIPYLPQLAANFDRFFVNTLELPFNVGAAFFMLLLLGLCFFGLFYTLKKNKVLLNTALLCFTMIVIGFSVFTIVIIRSSAKTPTNEYQPDNPYTLIRYLGREQYGSNPLVYGQAFASPYEYETDTYWAPSVTVDSDGNKQDSYILAKTPVEPKYHSDGKMFFPRMWSSNGYNPYRDINHPKIDGYRPYIDQNPSPDSHADFYLEYISDYTLLKSEYGTYIMPSFKDNLKFFFDFQMNWMYWRYFMWNFAGRQNDLHGRKPNEFKGNWECGIDFIDHHRLGDQSDAPPALKDNKGKNHYYMLPLLLGLIGIFFQFARDKRGSWVTFLMFFMTGIAIVVYLNQPPDQVRERDYAYAGSFYTFSIWIGIAVAALYTWLIQLFKTIGNAPVEAQRKVSIATVVTVATLGVPTLMAVENWDDHDRSNRYTAVEMAKNYLNSVGQNGILITHGDNDTFPLWYVQEVEGFRTDVRVANTSLLGTDWHIDQMKWATNESAPLDLKLTADKYLYGTNDQVCVDPYNENADEVVSLKEMMRVFLKGGYKIENPYSDEPGQIVDYIPYRNFSIPVNRENVIKYGILPEKYADKLPNEIVLSIPKKKGAISKPELFILDLLSNYEWDRPLNLLAMGGYGDDGINIGLKEYLMYEGFSYKFVPIKNKMSSSAIGFSDPEDLYYKMKNVFTWDALKRTDYYVDYQNNSTFCGILPQRLIFVNVAKELMEAGENEKAIEILDMCQECVPEENYPLDMTSYESNNEHWVIEMIATYASLGEYEKAADIMKRFRRQLVKSRDFYGKFGSEDAEDLHERISNYIDYLVVLSQEEGQNMMAKIYDLLPEDEVSDEAEVAHSVNEMAEDQDEMLQALFDKALAWFNMYRKWMSYDDWAIDRMGNQLLQVAYVLGRTETMTDFINSYADILIQCRYEYDPTRSEITLMNANLEQLKKDAELLRKEFYDSYVEYQYLYEEYEKNPSARINEQINSYERKLYDYQGRLGDLEKQCEVYEDAINNNLYRFTSTMTEMYVLYQHAQALYEKEYAPSKIETALKTYYGPDWKEYFE